MALYEGGLPDELIKMFETLERDTSQMLGEMVQAGAKVTAQNVKAKMPNGLKKVLIKQGDALRVTRVYKTPSDDGTNCQVMIDGYFYNRFGRKTPAPLVANMFEYGSTKRKYPKQPYFRNSFNKKQIETAMLKVQEKYIKEG